MSLKPNSTKFITVIGIMGAVGFILMMLEFPMPFIIPSFIKFDFSEIPALITAFVYGPLAGAVVCFIKNFLHLFFTTSAGVGEFSNFILGSVFISVAGIVYHRRKTKGYALLGAAIGAFIMSAVSVLTNYFIVYPCFVVIYGMPIETIIGAYSALIPTVDNLWTALLIFNLPFNFIKGMIDTAICFLVYKKLSPILKLKKPN